MNGIFASGRTKNVIEYHFKEVNFVIILFQLPVNITKQKYIYNNRHRRYVWSEVEECVKHLLKKLSSDVLLIYFAIG